MKKLNLSTVIPREQEGSSQDPSHLFGTPTADFSPYGLEMTNGFGFRNNKMTVISPCGRDDRFILVLVS